MRYNTRARVNWKYTSSVILPCADKLRSHALIPLSRHYHGCLVTFLGDTPASSLVGGFKEGVGGAYRTCMITSDDLSSVVSYYLMMHVYTCIYM